MCGIAGILRESGIQDRDHQALQDMAVCMAHRGPDDRGVYQNPGGRPVTLLAHLRLSILDLSSAGHQPMVDPTNRMVIVFNGEIYNFADLRVLLEEKGHSFQTQTDTEVLLRLYQVFGPDCANMLEGMFSFAIWDNQEKELFACRDRVGEKPFFFSQTGGAFVFASEIKALLKFPGFKTELNPQAIQHYIKLRYVPSPQTLFKGVYKLEPGQWLQIRKGVLEKGSYWKLPPSEMSLEGYTRQELAVEILDRLRHSVARRMVADVPVGAFLSGGIDSSTIVALMAELAGERVKTYSVGFEAPWESELTYARKVADQFKTDHHEILVRPKDYPDYLEQLIHYRDLPISEPADIPIFLLSRLAKEKVKVVLSGEGSDELLAGYPKYIYEPYTRLYRKWPLRFRRGIARILNEVPFVPDNFRRLGQIGTTESEMEMAFSWFSSMVGGFSTQILNPAFVNQENEREYYFRDPEAERYHSGQLMTYLDLKSWLPDNLLERADRNTMAHSLELRAPFLDYQFIEFCFTIPMSYKTSWFTTKILLKEAVAGLLPSEIIRRKKVGFATPIHTWFRKELKDWVGDILFSSEARSRGILNQEYLRRLFAEHVSGKRDHGKALWTAINLELWFKHFLSAEQEAK